MAGAIRHHGAAHVQVVGRVPCNQAVKAVAIAQGTWATTTWPVCVPHFADIEIDGEARTAIRLEVEDRQHRIPGSRLIGRGVTPSR